MKILSLCSIDDENSDLKIHTCCIEKNKFLPFKTRSDLNGVFVRICGENPETSSKFIVPKKQIQGMSFAEITVHLNLNYLVKFIVEVNIPKGTYLKRVAITPKFSSEEEITQYEVIKN